MPDVYAKDINSKYRDAQFIVDFLKKIGYKGDLNINNILFPSSRDCQRILEFLIESLTNSDSTALEINQNFSESNFVKMKVSQKFSNWTKENWVLPEIQQEIQGNLERNNNIIKKIIKYENSRIQNYRKILKELNLDNLSKNIL